MNFYGMPLVGSAQPRYSMKERRRMRIMGYDPYRAPVIEKPKCQAKTLKPTASMLTAVKGEEYMQCSAPAVKDELLCVTHRRMVSEAAQAEGVRARGTTIVKVPYKAFERTKFPLKFLKDNSDGDPAGPTDEFVDIYNTEQLKNVVKSLAKQP